MAGFSNAIAGGDGSVKRKYSSFAHLISKGKGLRNKRKAIRTKENNERKEKMEWLKEEKLRIKLGGNPDGDYGYNDYD